MLDAKLFEMSKQRYNFILHSKWQQKLFMEKQRQKTTVMKDLLKNVDLSKLNASVVKRTQGKLQPSNANLQNATEADKENLRNKENNEQLPEHIISDPVTKVVTFITEHSESNLYGQGVQSSDNDNPTLAVDESAYGTDGLPPIKITNSVVQEVVETRRMQTYILPLEGRWPVRDSRFLKLSEALCENYPKGSNYGFPKIPKFEGATFA